MTIADTSVAICLGGVLLSWQLAAAYLRKNSSLFNAMALFAFTWGLIGDYWHTKQASALVSPVLSHVGVYTSFLTLYIGGLLASYAHKISGTPKPFAVSSWQVWSLSLLFVVFADHGFAIPVLDVTLNPEQVAPIVDVGMGIIGFYAVASGVWVLCGSTTSIPLIIVFFFYTIAILGKVLTELRLPKSFDIARDLIAWINHNYELAVTILKVPYILVFTLAITYVGMKPPYRKTYIWPYVGRFVNIPERAPDTQENV